MYAPIKHKRVKRVSQPRWFNDDLNHEIQKRDHLFKKAKKSQKTEDWKHYKSVKNKVNELVGKTKEDYFKSTVAENRHNAKMLQNLIKNLTRKDEKDNHIRQLKDGEKILSDKQDMSELLNTFFVTQPRKILSSILTSASAALPQSNALFNDGVEFQVPNITTDQIKELLLSIPCHKATGLNGIGARVLKVAAPSISSSLARLINHCIETGEFPSKWKSAKVTPIYKGLFQSYPYSQRYWKSMFITPFTVT